MDGESIRMAVESEDLGRAARRTGKIKEATNRRRLSCSIWAQEAEDFAGVDIKIQRIDGCKDRRTLSA